MIGIKSGDYFVEIAKNPIIEKKNKAIISYLEEATGVKISSYPNHFVSHTQINVNNC